MKKLSISLFAVIAIVAAIGSAFTSAPKNNDDDFNIYSVTPQQVSTSATQLSDFNGFKSLEEAIGTMPVNLTSWKTSHTDIVCEDPDEKVCLAQLNEGENPTTDVVYQILPGDFSRE
ncbi:MAG: hypothetical protein WCF67_18195 [Chitinophagaceae bacterium]